MREGERGRKRESKREKETDQAAEVACALVSKAWELERRRSGGSLWVCRVKADVSHDGFHSEQIRIVTSNIQGLLVFIKILTNTCFLQISGLSLISMLLSARTVSLTYMHANSI